MKIKFAVYLQNQGDGSCVAKFFRTVEEAERYASRDDERYCDDIYPEELTVDEKGRLTNLETDGVI